MGLIDGAAGGDIMSGLGQLLDPAGFFAQGREGGLEGLVKNILDPLGLFGGIGKQLAGTSGAPADANQQVSQLFGADTVVDLKEKDKAKDRDKKADEDKKSSTATAQSVQAKTELAIVDRLNGMGYASPKRESEKSTAEPSQKPTASIQALREDSSDSHDKQIKPESKKNGNTSTGSSGKAAQSYSATASSSKGLTREDIAETLQHLNTVLAHIGHFSGGDLDDKFSMQNLRETVADRNSTPSEKAAAQYLIDHEEVFTALINISNTGNGCGNTEGVKKMIGALVHQLKTPPTASKPPKSPRAEAKPPSDDTSPVKEPPDAKGDGDKVEKKASKTKTKSVGFEGVISNLDDHLTDLEAKMAELTDKMIKGDKTAQSELSMLNLKYQQFMNIRREMYELLSNVKKTYDDMSMRAIGNIR